MSILTSGENRAARKLCNCLGLLSAAWGSAASVQRREDEAQPAGCVLKSRLLETLMLNVSANGETLVEVLSPDGSRRSVPVTDSPFLIGRGEGNHLQLADPRISRRCASILVAQGAHYEIQDLGHRYGIFVNGEKIEKKNLGNGDILTFGVTDSYKITFRHSAGDAAFQTMLTRIGGISKPDSSSNSAGLGKLNLLLEATSLLHSQLPLDSVLGTMLDHAISITGADRGLLLEADASGALHPRLARRKGGALVPAESLPPSQTALKQALEQQTSVITEDLNRADMELQAAQSIIAQALRSVIAVPLYAMHQSSQESPHPGRKRKHLLGVIYLDSRRPAAFYKLDRQILDALAVEAASILDNARLVERERERQRFEQELSIARQIQQALLPHRLPRFSIFRDYRHSYALPRRRGRLLLRRVFPIERRQDGHSNRRRLRQGHWRRASHDDAAGSSVWYDAGRIARACIQPYQPLSV